MKRLTLLRHAKSAWDDPVARDIERPLNARGHRAARAVGHEMRRLGLRFDAIVASPATRIVETIGEVARGYGATLDPSFDENIYLASIASLLDIVRATDESVNSLLLVGHSPGMEGLALHLAGHDDRALRASLAEKYPTGALAELNLHIDHWAAAEKGCGSLTRFVRPRDLDPELGPDEDS